MQNASAPHVTVWKVRRTDQTLSHTAMTFSLLSALTMTAVILIALVVGVGGKIPDRDATSTVPPPAATPKTAALPGDRLATNAAPASVPASLPDSTDRVADARARFGQKVREDFQTAGLAYPPRAIFLRAFKREGQLELWAQPGDGGKATPFRFVRSFAVLRASGRLGPKRREGDGQVPEGFYTIARFNPRSLFHLSLGLDYPNASDRLRAANPQRPGGDIFIHGGAESIGCLALGDEAAAQLYLVALEVHERNDSRAIPVHIFPCRMDAVNWREVLEPLATARPELLGFWRGLQPAFDFFENEKLPPVVTVKSDGSYALE